jgi:hypothetical protein
MILTPVGILGGPIAGADLVSGVIEWKGIFPYILAYWDIYVSAPLSRIVGAVAELLKFPEPPEILVDYFTLSVLLFASFFRARKLNAPSQILEALEKEALLRGAPGYSYVEPASLSRRPIDESPKDMMLMSKSSTEEIRIGSRTAGAADAIRKEFEPITIGAFVLLCVLGSIVWPVTIVVCTLMMLRDGIAVSYLSRPKPSGLFSLAARRVALAGDKALTEGMVSLLRERSVRLALAIAPFILFVVLCIFNIIAYQAAVIWPDLTESRAKFEVFVGAAGLAAALALTLVLFRKPRNANEDRIIRALERAHSKVSMDIDGRPAGAQNAE